MANPSYEKDWKIYLQCKECWEFKEINSENWYSHKAGYLWVLWRCRKCVLKWRSSEREHVMSRKRDMDRYHNNPKRKEDLYRQAKNRIKRHEDNWERWNALHAKAERLIIKLWNRPTECPICWKPWRIVAHHPDLEKWDEIVFCCPVCHSKIHSWEITEFNIIKLKEDTSKTQLTEWELAQERVNQLCRKLRQMTLPPSRMDQSEEWIKRWRDL